MRITKDLLIRIIEVRARRHVGELTCQLIRSEAEDREMILAALQFERWLADSCQDCLIDS